MGKKIAVIGMGQGGMCAAISLAKAGYDVKVFEKAERGQVSYDWEDDIRADIFGLCDLDMPPEDVYRQKRKWLFVSPDGKYSLPVPPLPPMEEISVYRRGLSEYFASELEKAGGEALFQTPVTSLIVEDDAVKGIRTFEGEERFDLVIDASGMNSPFRAQLPSKFLVQKAPDGNGVLFGYRAFFDRAAGENTREEDIECTMHVKHLGEAGISWCNLVEENLVDVLIGRVGSLSDEQIADAISDLRAQNPVLGERLIRAHKVQICLRAAAGVFVADGYVAVGDSAFMTMPLMGSGIESSMKAGKLLADRIKEIDDFSAASLWEFEKRYMKEIGAGFAFIDVLKRWALDLDPKKIDWVFGGGLIEKSDLALVSTDTSGEKPKIPAKSILKKICLLLGKPSLTCGALGCLIKAAKAKKIAAKIPGKYDLKKIAKWAKRYEKALLATGKKQTK